MKVTCKNCSKCFNKQPSQIKKSPNHYCSKSCAASINNLGKQRNKSISLQCVECSTSFYRNKNHRSRNRCPDCSLSDEQRIAKSKNMTLGEYQDKQSVKGKHPSWTNSHVRNFVRYWNKNLEKVCQVCGYSKHTEYAHIKPITSFSKETTLGTINSPDNILILCRNCHWEFDHSHIKLEDIPPRKSN